VPEVWRSRNGDSVLTLLSRQWRSFFLTFYRSSFSPPVTPERREFLLSSCRARSMYHPMAVLSKQQPTVAPIYAFVSAAVASPACSTLRRSNTPTSFPSEVVTKRLSVFPYCMRRRAVLSGVFGRIVLGAFFVLGLGGLIAGCLRLLPHFPSPHCSS